MLLIELSLPNLHLETYFFWKPIVNFSNFTRPSDRFIHNEIHKLKEFVSYLSIILKINFCRMNSIISYYPDAIKRLLHLNREALLHKSTNIVVEILTLLPEMNAELLYHKAQECSTSSR